MAGRLDGLVAVISGGARGQGAAEARRFIDEGAHAVVGDVLDDEGAGLAEQLGDACRYEHLDVTSEKDWARVIDGTVERFGRLDVLVNNAGILRFNRLVDTPLDEYLDVVMVNQVGTFLGIRAAIPPMKADGGSIINVSSIEGLRGMKNLASYTSSKFAVRGLTKVAALELARFGIRVNSIHPGMVKTPMADFGNLDAVEAIIPLKRPATAAEVADLVVYLASPESAYCTGAEFVIDGGVTAGSMFSAL
jgi:3alpha(or 20beta)-hydroxysteroid dehydrogenase